MSSHSEIINAAYRRVYRRYDSRIGWVEYDPEIKTHVENDVLFYYILNHPSSFRWTTHGLKVVDVVSPVLWATLKRCLPFLDRSLDVDEDDDEEYDDDITSSIHFSVDARTLVAHEDVLQVELSRLQEKIENLHGTKHAENVTCVDNLTKDSTQTSDSSLAASLATEIDQLKKLLSCLETEFANTKNRLNALLSKKSITFDLLWFLFRRGRTVTFADPDSGLLVAGKITSSSYDKDSIPLSFKINVQYIDYSGEALYWTSYKLRIFEYSSHVEIETLNARPLEDPQVREYLTSRGRIFVEMQGKHYLHYHDFLLLRGSYDELLKFRAAGRAMVDASAYMKMNLKGRGHEPREAEKLSKLSDDELTLCASTVLGYSFVTKQWGRFAVDKFTPIAWNKAAFNQLVLPPGVKDLIHCLVRADRQDGTVIKDIISGKGGGCIIVLHGRPGTGKTLTAEAVAEDQEKPLLSVSVGDLGTSAAQVEKKLKEILELAALWDAVVLFDEADIFMEARSLHELERNAMVGVFLRLLEYHERIMFLTTNRVNTFDEAFKSRISVAVQYKDLDKSARRGVWENFLKLAEVEVVTQISDERSLQVTVEQLEDLASRPLNGREIKNTMRTAQALANTSKRRLGYDVISSVLDVVQQFDVDFNDK